MLASGKITEYSVIPVLGQGSCGVVAAAPNESGASAALKMCPLTGGIVFGSDFHREIEAMRQIPAEAGSPHVATCIRCSMQEEVPFPNDSQSIADEHAQSIADELRPGWTHLSVLEMPLACGSARDYLEMMGQDLRFEHRAHVPRHLQKPGSPT